MGVGREEGDGVEELATCVLSSFEFVVGWGVGVVESCAFLDVCGSDPFPVLGVSFG